jgi:heat shock protein HslJ
MMRASFNSLEGEWELTDFKKASLTPDLKNKATLTLTKRSEDLLQMSGRSFVNWYGGSFRLDETKGLIVSTGPMVSTEIGAAPELMEAETRHLYGLEKAIAFELTTSSQLKLYLGEKTSESTEVMIFNRKN